MSQQCMTDGCMDTAASNGYCRGCNFLKKFDLDGPRPQDKEATNKQEVDMAKRRECSSEGCDRPAQKEGLCYRCYKLKYGCEPYSGKTGGTKRAAKKQPAEPTVSRPIKKEQSENISIAQSLVNDVRSGLKLEIRDQVQPMLDDLKTKVAAIEEWFAS